MGLRGIAGGAQTSLEKAGNKHNMPTSPRSNIGISVTSEATFLFWGKILWLEANFNIEFCTKSSVSSPATLWILCPCCFRVMQAHHIYFWLLECSPYPLSTSPRDLATLVANGLYREMIAQYSMMFRYNHFLYNFPAPIKVFFFPLTEAGDRACT